jgi:hypothetical protein
MALEVRPLGEHSVGRGRRRPLRQLEERQREAGVEQVLAHEPCELDAGGMRARVGLEPEQPAGSEPAGRNTREQLPARGRQEA